MRPVARVPDLRREKGWKASSRDEGTAQSGKTLSWQRYDGRSIDRYVTWTET